MRYVKWIGCEVTLGEALVRAPVSSVELHSQVSVTDAFVGPLVQSVDFNGSLESLRVALWAVVSYGHSLQDWQAIGEFGKQAHRFSRAVNGQTYGLESIRLPARDSPLTEVRLVDGPPCMCLGIDDSLTLDDVLGGRRMVHAPCVGRDFWGLTTCAALPQPHLFRVTSGALTCASHNLICTHIGWCGWNLRLSN